MATTEMGYCGISFPPRIGTRGGWVMSSTSPVDITHIKESIQIILGTMLGERVCEPEFGSDLKRVVFENKDVTLVNLIRFKIEEALTRWEPRIEVTNINVLFGAGTEDQGTIYVTIDFRVLRTQVEDSVRVVLRREGVAI